MMKTYPEIEDGIWHITCQSQFRGKSSKCVFWPYLLYLRICGLYFDEYGSESSRWTIWRCYSIGLLFMNVCTCVWMTVDTILKFDLILNFGNSFILITHCLWFYLMTVTIFTCYRLSSSQRLCKEILAGLTDVFPVGSERSQVEQYARKSTFILVIVAMVFHVGNAIVMLLAGFEVYPFENVIVFKNHWPVSESKYLVILGGFIYVLNCSVWIISNGLFLLAVTNVNKHFEVFNEDFNRRTSSFGRIAIQDLVYLDKRHQKLSRIVVAISSNFGLFIVATFGYAIIISLGDTYFMVYSDDTVDDITRILTAFWLITDLSMYAAIIVVSIRTKELATECLSVLYSISTEYYSTKAIIQLKLFVDRLSIGPPIEISGLGFFAMSKDFISTLVGAYVTYYFILAQFKDTGK